MNLSPRLRLILATLLALPLLIHAQQPPPAAPSSEPARGGQPSFRSAVDVVSMSVTVTDNANRYMTDLTQNDFEVFEDGVKQDITLFNRTNLPIALSLLIDTSSSMEDRMTTAQDAAIGF